MTVGPKFNNYSSKMGNAPKYKEPNKKIDPAAIREAALREAMEIAKACERQNYARVTDDEKHGFYRAGLRSAGQAISAAINARIEKGAAE